MVQGVLWEERGYLCLMFEIEKLKYGGRARNAQFRLRRELPAPGTKGRLFCICLESRNLT
jgi:hypothetical protein